MILRIPVTPFWSHLGLGALRRRIICAGQAGDFHRRAYTYVGLSELSENVEVGTSET